MTRPGQVLWLCSQPQASENDHKHDRLGAAHAVHQPQGWQGSSMCPASTTPTRPATHTRGCVTQPGHACGRALHPTTHASVYSSTPLMHKRSSRCNHTRGLNYLHASSYSHTPHKRYKPHRQIQCSNSWARDVIKLGTHYSLHSSRPGDSMHSPAESTPRHPEPTQQLTPLCWTQAARVRLCLTSKRDHSMPFKRRRRGDHAPNGALPHAKAHHPAPQGPSMPAGCTTARRLCTSSRTRSTQPM